MLVVVGDLGVSHQNHQSGRTPRLNEMEFQTLCLNKESGTWGHSTKSYQMVMSLSSCHLSMTSYFQETRAEGSGTGALESPSLWKVKAGDT